MSTVKLYLSIFLNGAAQETLVIRDLSILENKWSEYSTGEYLSIIHIGFLRPKIRLDEQKSIFSGHILVTASTKWALPSGFQTTTNPVTSLDLNDEMIPAYLVINGFGQELNPNDYQHLIKGNQVASQPIKESSNQHTIVSAAKHVLETVGKPLNIEDILAYIVGKKLYNFGAERPLEALRVQLNRYTPDSNYTRRVEEPCFGKTEENKFFLLADKPLNLSGWLKVLLDSGNPFPQELMKYNIYDDATYIDNRSQLPTQLKSQAEGYRYQILKTSISDKDPGALTEILPESILESPIYSLGFTVRIENVLISQGYKTLKDGVPYDQHKMLDWANFGVKCIIDFCAQLKTTTDRILLTQNQSLDMDTNDTSGLSEKIIKDKLPATENSSLIELKPLIEHFAETLDRLKEKERQIIEKRTGAYGPLLTLQAVADSMDITRERVRQIQKKYVEKIIREEFWDDCIAKKIGQLLAVREGPLFLEMLEIEDKWFKGFLGNYKHLAAIIELFSENEIRVIQIQDANVITRIKQDVWDKIVSNVRCSLNDKAKDKSWSRTNLEFFFLSELNKVGAPELAPCLQREFSEFMQFSGDESDSILIGFGKSAEQAVSTILARAEKPLHYSKIAVLASELLGKEVEERRAQNALMAQKAKLFGRGIYGLKHHNPLSEDISEQIAIVVEKMIYEGPLMKQWHSSEILNSLFDKYPSLPNELDPYILNIILDDRKKLAYLNRMIWARADSNQTSTDRIDIANAYTRLLEDTGVPMTADQLREKLREIRGVNELQIQPNERMILVAPDTWGLVDRDIGVSMEVALVAVQYLFKHLKLREKGIHVSEVDDVMHSCNLNEYPEPYILFNLAQRDNRFRLAKAMFLGLSEWEDSRRLNYTQAVKQIIDEMQCPMSAAEISFRVEQLTDLTVNFPISNLLLHHGAQFEPVSKKWFK